MGIDVDEVWLAISRRANRKTYRTTSTQVVIKSCWHSYKHTCWNTSTQEY